MAPLTTQYPGSVSDAWAHQTSMQRATGSDHANLMSTPYGSQLQAQSALARDESEAEPGLAQGATKLNEGVGAALNVVSSL